MKTYDAKVSMHHRLPDQSSQSEAFLAVANAVLTLQHVVHVPQHHVGAVQLTATFGCVAPSLLQ
jgi:hypothetical protein